MDPPGGSRKREANLARGFGYSMGTGFVFLGRCASFTQRVLWLDPPKSRGTTLQRCESPTWRYRASCKYTSNYSYRRYNHIGPPFTTSEEGCPKRAPCSPYSFIGLYIPHPKACLKVPPRPPELPLDRLRPWALSGQRQGTRGDPGRDRADVGELGHQKGPPYRRGHGDGYQ